MIFSVVVPTHHRKTQLRALLRSLEAQTLDASLFEVLVVPSPNDLGVQNLPASSLQLKILSSEKDPYQGKSASYKRNYGVQMAQTPWIAFIDDDCVADKNWLLSAQQRVQTTSCDGIEGATHIPKPSHPTYTYKGLQKISKAGGYQTCNMFYKRETFLACGGFDLSFPFYLEDTDLAWSLLDKHYQIVYDENCIVKHPVPPPDVRRLYHNAVRTRLIPYLYKKHKKLFKENRWQALQKFHWLFLLSHLFLLYWILQNPTPLRLIASLFIVFLLSLAYTARQLHGCRFTAKEALQMLFFYTITPWITFVQLWRGNWEQKTLVYR